MTAFIFRWQSQAWTRTVSGEVHHGADASDNAWTGGAIRMSLVLLAFGLGAAFLGSILRDFANDDPYITYRYTRNLVQGHGFVYNIGLDVLSTTTPLYALILTPAYALYDDLPVFSNLLSAMSLGVSGLLLYLFAARHGQEMAGLIGGLLTLFHPLILSTFGAETSFYILLIIGSFFLFDRGRWALAAVLAGFATLTRGDGALVAVALAIAYILTRRKWPLRPFLAYLIVVMPWYLYSWVHFGSPFPATLQAKLQQSDMAATVGFFEGVAHWARVYGRHPIYWLYVPFMVLGVANALRRNRWALPLLLWAVLYFLGYSVLNVPRYHWYYSPLIPLLMLLVGLGAAASLKWIVSSAQLRPVMGLALAGLLVWPSLRASVDLAQISPDGRAQIYLAAGSWLNTHTPEEASVGTLEVGILGYESDRTIIDFGGLVQPEIGRRVSGGFEDAAAWAITNYRPDYLVFHPGWFPHLVAEPWFAERYRDVKQFENATYVSNPLVVYAASGNWHE
jgi:hypothetical protein